MSARPEFVRAALSEARLALDRHPPENFPRESRSTQPDEHISDAIPYEELYPEPAP